MSHASATVAAVALLLVPPTIGQRSDDPATPGRELSRGHTVIRGTYRWDIETNTQGRTPGIVDVQWEQIGPDKQYLMPLAGAGLVLLADLDFDKLTRDDLAKVKFGRDGLANTLLVPGAIVGVRTVEGNLAKVKVVQHTNSPVARAVPTPSSRRAAEGQPGSPKRHLEVVWVLYEKGGPAR